MPTEVTDNRLPEPVIDHWTSRYAESVATAQASGRPFVLVRVGGERFAVALEDLDEVASVGTAIALPQVGALVLGLANIRGELVPLLDTAALLGVQTGYRLGSANRTLVVRDRRGRRTGLPVDRVEAVEDLDPALFRPQGGADASELIRRTGLAEHRGAALVRIDLGPLRAGQFNHF